jgi:hypothetical protein
MRTWRCSSGATCNFFCRHTSTHTSTNRNVHTVLSAIILAATRSRRRGLRRGPWSVSPCAARGGPRGWPHSQAGSAGAGAGLAQAQASRTARAAARRLLPGGAIHDRGRRQPARGRPGPDGTAMLAGLTQGNVPLLHSLATDPAESEVPASCAPGARGNLKGPGRPGQ